MKHTLAQVGQIIVADDGPRAQSELVLFKAGQIEIEGGGKVIVDEDAYLAVAGEFQRRGNDLVIDYEHQTLTGEKAPAAGWITDLKWDPDRGIIAVVSWTDAAAAHLANREYRYFSPVFRIGPDRRVKSVHSVALTNSPRTNHLTALAAKDEGEGDTMELLKRLIEKFGLAEDAGEDEVLAAIDDLMARAEEGGDGGGDTEEVAAALDLEGSADRSTIVASIHALKQATRTMVPRQEFEALKDQIAKRDATDTVAAAMTAGKITPAQKDWAEAYARKDLPGFQTFVAKAPVVVPVEPLPDKDPTPADDNAPDETALLVASMMGNTAEDLKKYGGGNDSIN